MSNQKRKMDDKHTKMLREFASLPPNKHCFDCHQRGPTYVNMTIGSFVCTGCSGILRGLNPPHRVKSISMASFTPDEIELMKNRGNEHCKKVWLGLYDGDSRSFDGFRDEQQMKDFLNLKYEKKRWYVSPNEIAKQQAILAQHNTSADSNTSDPQPMASPSSNQRQPRHQNSLIDTSSPSRPNAIPRHQPSLSHAAATKSLDLFDKDPFSAPPQPQTKPVPQSSVTNDSGGFADFANFDAFTRSQPAPAPPPAAFGLLPPPGASHDMLMPKSATVPASLSNPIPAAVSSATAGAVSTAPAPGDPYSALAELDELFGNTTTQSSSTNGTSVSVFEKSQDITQSWAAKSAAAFGSNTGNQHSVFGSTPPSTNDSQTGVGILPKSSSAMTGFGQPVSSGTFVSQPGFGPASNPFFSNTPSHAPMPTAATSGGWPTAQQVPTSAPVPVGMWPVGPTAPATGWPQVQQMPTSAPTGAWPPAQPANQFFGGVPRQPNAFGGAQMQPQMNPGQMWGQQFPQTSAAPQWQAPQQPANPFLTQGPPQTATGGMPTGQQQMNWNPFLG